MQKSNLIVFLKRLSKRDWREFRKFVRSPYFNQREDVVRLFDYIEEAMRDLPPMALHRAKVYNKVFPGDSFDEKRLRHTTSFLLKVLKKYLIQAELEQDEVQAQQYLCKALRKKRMEVFFEKELLATHLLLEKQVVRDSHFYFQKYQLGMERAGFTNPQRRSEAINFQSITDQLTISYISNMLRLSCEIQSHQTMSGQVYDLKLLPEVLAFVESGKYLEEPVVGLYFHCYNALENLEKQTPPLSPSTEEQALAKNTISKSEFHFYKLKQLIQEHWKLFPSSEIRDIYLYAINYCIKRLNAGDRNFIREAFELFRAGLKNKTLLAEGVLSSFSYKNITRLGMALLETEWVGQFLEDYKKYLHPRERENTWRYNLAFFYFQQQNYKQAMRLLLQVEFKDVLNNLDARRMLLKSYFELGEYNALDSLLDSFSRYIHRQKDMGYHRDNYLNLIRFVKKIIHGGVKDKKILRQLKTEVEATNHLAERAWLVEKLSV